MLACVDRDDPFADSVVKPEAAAIKRRRLGANPWRAHEESTSEPGPVHHTPKGGGVTLAEPIVLTRLFHPSKYNVQNVA